MFWKFQGLSHGLRRGGRRLIGATCFVAGFRYMFYKPDEDKIFVLEYCKLKQTKYSEWAWDAGVFAHSVGYCTVGYNVMFKPTVTLVKWIKFPIGCFVASSILAIVSAAISRYSMPRDERPKDFG
eukprot:836773_1